MSTIVEQIKEKPWTGWAMAGVLAIALVVVIIRLMPATTGEFSAAALSETVTIRYTDTDEEEPMTRGELLKRMLRDSGGIAIDPNKGILNPKTGKPTGFLHDKGKWDKLVKDVNEQAAAARTPTPTSSK